ncbi:MAG: hypothetical protein RLZZ383_1437 [Pseudomonadota bacterium]|jgi:hypothetical protein
MRVVSVLLPWFGLACAPSATPPQDTGPVAPSWPEATWNRALPATATAVEAPRGWLDRRAVFHLHSPYSHDACDGQGWVDGVMDTDCEADLRAALCDASYDVAFVTDHPDYGDAQPFEALFHAREGDVWVTDDAGRRYALDVTCPDGHVVQWRAGFEDELMPVGLHDHVDPDPATRHDLLNRYDDSAVAAISAAGGRTFLAHTEQRVTEPLLGLQRAGLHAVEAFNVHAMFDPRIRPEALGLDGFSWLSDIGPFVADDAVVQPDLFFLTVFQEQAPSIANWEALLQQGPMMATAGSDAHQNVLPIALVDGERGDSYRRTLRWFSTHLLAHGPSAEDVDEAISARRSYIAFEILGTPTGMDVHLRGEDGAVYEMGADAPAGTLVVTCPTLADGSPYGSESPEITATITRNGEVMAQGCGEHPVDTGVWRVRFDITPHHLAPFLTGQEAWIRTLPWVYTGAFRVAMP